MLLDHLDALGLSHYDMPEYMLFLDELPLTASGKITKRELVRWVEEGRHTPVPVRYQRGVAARCMTMRAIEFAQFGPVETASLVEKADPQPRPE